MKDKAKAIWRRFARTQVWRAWQRYGDRRGNRLAGATTFFGFLSMFPLIVLAAAVTAALLPASAIGDLKDALQTNLPGVGDKINLDSLVANAGTIGWISGASLLLTGLGWIDSMRASIRSMHELDDQPGNPVKLKLADLGALAGLGLIGAVATGSTSVLSGLIDRIADWLNLTDSWLGRWGLEGIGLLLGVLSGAVLFLYLQTGMPRIVLPRKVSLIAALAGGIVFVAAQKLGNVYVNNVIGNNQAYGALALPLALLVWIYLMTRIIMLIAAWAKEATLDHEARAAGTEELAPGNVPPAAVLPPRSAPAPGTSYKVVPVPARKADTVAVAAGAVLGATVTVFGVLVGRGARTVVDALRRR
jgi:membrane protein